MDKLLIRGGRPLQGPVDISGAKNAALPELCAALLTADPVELRNVPRLQDVSTSSGSAAFLAPEMSTGPCRGRPPRMRSLSMVSIL